MTDTDTILLDEPNEQLIALNCDSQQNIAHYIASLHREIVKLWMRVDPERQRDAAQGNGEEGRTGAVSPAPLTTAAAADRSAPSPAPIDASTHWEGCGLEGGRRHYECLVGEYEDLRAQLAERETEAFRAKLAEREKLIDATATAWLAIDGIPWEGAIDEAMKAAVAEIVRLRARLAEREAELKTASAAVITLKDAIAEREAELAALRSSERERLIAEVSRVVLRPSSTSLECANAAEMLAIHERARRAKEKP